MTRRVLCVLCVLFAALSLEAATRHRAPILAFMKASGYPKGRPGYVVDHIIPLCAGGQDDPTNMQWQEKVASYRKDVFERQLCAAMRKQGVWLVPKARTP